VNHEEWTDACADPLIVSVATVGQNGIVISGTPPNTDLMMLTDNPTGQASQHPVTMGANGLGFWM